MSYKILVTVKNYEQFAETFEDKVRQDYILLNLRERLECALNKGGLDLNIAAEYTYPSSRPYDDKYADFFVLSYTWLEVKLCHFEVEFVSTIG